MLSELRLEAHKMAIDATEVGEIESFKLDIPLDYLGARSRCESMHQPLLIHRIAFQAVVARGYSINCNT